MNRLAILFALAIAACAPSKPAPDVAPSDAGAPDATTSGETEHRVGSAIVCPIPGSCISGVIPQTSLPPCDGGETYVGGDGGMRCAVSSGGTSLRTVDGGGLATIDGGLVLWPECDGGVLAKPPGGGAWECTQGLGVNSVSGTPPIVITGPGFAPTVTITASTDSVPGTMSAADKTKLDGIGSGANVASVTGSGIASASPTTGAVVVTVAAPSLVNHGTGADLSSCTTSQLVEGGSSALSCITISGDCVYTAGGGVICGKANAGSGGELDFGASTGTLTAASTATAPGLAQAVAGSGVTPVNTTLSPQAPNASSSTTPSGTPAEVVANWAVPVSTGHESAFLAERNGAAVGAIGVPDGYGALAVGYLWLGANAALGTRTSGNFAIAMDSSGDALVNSTSGIAGFTGGGAYYFKVNAVTGEIGAPGNYSVGAIAGTYDGCVGGCVGFAKASSNPSGTATGSVIYADHATGDLVSYPLGATAPVLDVGATATTLVSPLGGSTSTAFNFTSSTVSVGVGGTTNLSTANCATPIIVLTATGSTTSDIVLSFSNSTPCETGVFNVVFPAITFGSLFSIDFKNGTKTISYGGAGTNAYNGPVGRSVWVTTFGANNIATSF